MFTFLTENTRRRIFKMIVCLWIVAVGGCYSWLAKPAVQTSGVSPIEMKKYAEAVDAYNAMDYEKAARHFVAIKEQTTDAAISRMALYGAACSRLMAASTPKDYNDAMTLWDAWIQCAPRNQEYENPLLIAPLIKEKMIFSQIPLAMEEIENAEKNQDATRWLLFRANQELQRSKAKLEEATQAIDSRDKKIKTLEKEISRLNQQIKDFETIDQKIQKKKSSIPSAD